MPKKQKKENCDVVNKNLILSLINPIENSKYLYKNNDIFYINCKKNGNFISDILNEQINNIFDKLENGIFTFKYQIYGDSIFQPSFLFHQKNELKKFMIFDKIDNYKYNKFGIRLEFIDPDSNRYIYIITIE